MPLSLPAKTLPTILSIASTYYSPSPSSNLQHLWTTARSAPQYQSIVRAARLRASHHIMLCGTTAYLKRLDQNEQLDRLEDLLLPDSSSSHRRHRHSTTASSSSSYQQLTLTLHSIEDLEASERAWKSIVEVLKQIDNYLTDAVAVERDEDEDEDENGDGNAECHEHESPAQRLSILAGMIVGAAGQAERVAARDPILSGFRTAKL